MHFDVLGHQGIMQEFMERWRLIRLNLNTLNSITLLIWLTGKFQIVNSSPH